MNQKVQRIVFAVLIGALILTAAFISRNMERPAGSAFFRTNDGFVPIETLAPAQS